MTKFNVDRVLVFIIGISLIIKILVSFFVQLGNDEVYYWTYALYPDWSHFDHPPMVGWMIQFFTFNLNLDSEVFLRLGSIIIAGVNTYMMFRLGRLLKDELTGWYAAVLYSTSIYFGITAGFMILPDAPQLFFWILALFCLIKSLPVDPTSSKGKENMLFFGLAAGLAMMAKYTSVFLWIGAIIYILFYNRSWLKSWVLYVAIAITLFLFSPAMLWNFENNFLSFSFHVGRIAPVNFQVQNFFIEIVGEFLYQNPLIYLLMVMAL
ncbi:MAG: glycosyltransferase family 39 protein, partial [Cyclobacteriaceae bacterium]|nr:glycosyltransferase family 39 protein [Cyclobacteriaceae bacterium]